jgi:hypothetical protein
MKAQEQGVAGLTVTREELTKHAESMIKSARSMVELLMKEKIILPPPM